MEKTRWGAPRVGGGQWPRAGEEHPEAKEGLPGWREQEKMRSTQDGKEAAPRVCRA